MTTTMKRRTLIESAMKENDDKITETYPIVDSIEEETDSLGSLKRN